MRLRICRLYPLPNSKTTLFQKVTVLNMTTNYSWWCHFRFGGLEIVNYFFIVITSRFTQSQCGSIYCSHIYGSNGFVLNYSYSIVHCTQTTKNINVQWTRFFNLWTENNCKQVDVPLESINQWKTLRVIGSILILLNIGSFLSPPTKKPHSRLRIMNIC